MRLPGLVGLPLTVGLAALLVPAQGLLGVRPDPGSAGAVTPAGSCEVPLPWRVAELDERFGLSPGEAEAAVREAAGLWERAAGRALFPHDPEAGFPVRFVYDERHGEIRQVLEATERLQERADEITELRSELETARRELEWDQGTHAERLRELERRLESHRLSVQYWNDRGGAPPEEMERLEAAREQLEQERAVLNEAAEALNRRAQRLNADARGLNRLVEEYNRERQALEGRGVPGAIDSGHYRESRRTLGPWVLSVDREVRVYQFDDRAHLVRVIAHELGHALGLGHVGEPEAVMYVYPQGRREAAAGSDAPRLHARDVETFRERCPEVFVGGRGR